jgi:hypothetical protein
MTNHFYCSTYSENLMFVGHTTSAPTLWYALKSTRIGVLLVKRGKAPIHNVVGDNNGWFAITCILFSSILTMDRSLMDLYFSFRRIFYLHTPPRTPNRAIALTTKGGSGVTATTGIAIVGVTTGTSAAIHGGRRRCW